MRASIHFRWPEVLVLWLCFAATTLIPQTTFAYKGHEQTNVPYDSGCESAIGYDAALAHATDRNKSGTTGDRVLLAKIVELVAARVTPQPTGQFYSTAFETRLSVTDFFLIVFLLKL